MLLLRLVTFVTLSLACLAQAKGFEKHSHLSSLPKRHHATRSTPDTIHSSEEMQLAMQDKLSHENKVETAEYDGFQGTDSSLSVIKGTNPDTKVDTTTKGPYISPEFFPTPQVNGAGNWKEAVRKAKAYIQQFNLDERVALVTGVGWNRGPPPHCVCNIAPNAKHGFPGLCLQDSPLGIRFTDLNTVFPAGITTAATFSSQLTYQRSRAMGEEFRMKGVNVALTPGMNMHRSPAAGRVWEMAGADPYVAGEAAYLSTKGIQDAGVQACAKHYIAADQEINRNTYSSNIDGRTEREIHLHPFMRAVQADVASIMCAYNLVNNSWACQNSEMMNNRLMTELGFQGYVISDWGAQHSGVAAANAGLSMSMPGQIACCSQDFQGSYWGPNLTLAVNNGSVNASRLEDMATRILAGWYLLGQDNASYPKPNFDAFDAFYGDHLNVMTLAHSNLSRQVGAAGAVLLKNTNNALPLRKNMRKMAVNGQNASPAFRGANVFGDRGGVDGMVGTGWGSGTSEYAYFISPYEALQARARETNTGFYWNFDNFATGRSKTISDERGGVDAAIVFVHANSGENYITVDGNMGDRNNLTLWANGDNLIRNVSSVQTNTIVVIHSPGQIDVEAWIDNPNVTAVVHAHLAGGEGGNAIADILYGDVNPSGRLPYTIAKKRSDYSADVIYFEKDETKTSQILYTEKLNIDYRHFDANNIEPRFAFGYGLSYTKFDYSNLSGQWLGSSAWNEREWSLPLPGWLFEDVYQVDFTIHNSGKVAGHEVPQVYLGFDPKSGEPPKVLRKFDRYLIQPGGNVVVSYRLNRYDLSIWNSETQRWWKPDGQVKIYVGASSRDIRLTMNKM